MDSNSGKIRKKNPRENSFVLSSLTFAYIIPTFVKGFKRNLSEADLTETLSEHKSKYLGDKLERKWTEEEENAKKHGRSPSLRKVLLKVFGWEFLMYGFVISISDAIKIIQPIIIGKFIDYYSPYNTTITKDDAFIYGAIIVLCSLLTVLMFHPYMLGVCHLGMKLRVACCSLIYRKSLRLSSTALGQTTVGQVVNLLSNDVNRFDVALMFAHHLWVGPLETLVVLYLLYSKIGESAFVGIIILIIFIPIQMYIGKKISNIRLKVALRTDERVRMMSEIINGIQVIKMYAWELPFAKVIALTRRYEISMLRWASFMRAIVSSFMLFNIRASIFASVITYVLCGNDINAEKVFVVTAFYNAIRSTMTVFFPNGIVNISEANVSINRLNKFLTFEEIDEEHRQETNHIEAIEKTMSDEKGRIGIFIENGYAKWNLASVDNTLSNISLSVRPGKLQAIIGPVGSGKSSLFQAILKELPLINGSVKVNGKISYASQEPWLFSGSVRQNILFGLPMDRKRYNAVIETCSLERDFTLLPYGDKTLVGDRGVSLSGGQRARINLARAVYKQADIYLLDDPLSAVDTHVGKELFENCVTGYLSEKTVILITHQLQYLNNVEHIIFLEDGHIKSEGTFNELQNAKLDFTKLLIKSEEEKELDEKEKIFNTLMSITSRSSVGEAPIQVEEHMSKGTLGSHVYKAYLRAGGNWCLIALLFGSFIFVQGIASGSDYFLTFWVKQENQNYKLTKSIPVKLSDLLSSSVSTVLTNTLNLSRDSCIIIYSTLVGMLMVMTLIRSFSFFAVCMRASTRLHDNMFRSLSKATMNFFNNNPAGRILNRFSKDMGAVDELLPGALIDSLQNGLAILGIIIVIGSVSPLLFLVTILMGVVFYLLRVVYLRTSRNVKRLEGVTRSPVFSHINSTLEGLTTIRAFGAQEILTKEFDIHQDLHSCAWHNFMVTSRAFGYWLDLTCIIYITIVVFSFLLLNNDQFGGNVGLVVTQAIAITGLLQWGMRQSTELENQMTSVERIIEYGTIEHERALESDESKKPETSWPRNGNIVFKHLFLKYSPEDPPVLKNLNFVVQPKEKIGIVGRTGAGKSSLISALFQLTITEGQIIIDGLDITQLGLHDLRSKISIIPQEPVLFSGTLRKNLDPFEEYLDANLWKALEDVELKEAVSDLNCEVSEGGSNFSIGQRQLVCLARAILRKNRILVLDEATANVDPQTDGHIQRTIREKFNDCTVLTIAHRLHTVMDSDKILVMDAGTVKEFDHPFILLQNKDGILYGMVQQTGKATFDMLYQISKNNFDESKK